jgi:hypothetical protein
MKSLIFVCLTILIAASLGKELPNSGGVVRRSVETPTQFDLDPDRLPINTAAVEGTTVILECAIQSPSTSHNLIWYEYAYSPLGSPISSNENVGAHPQRDRYTIIHGDPLQYSLRISPVVLADGGVYECMDQAASPANKRFHAVSLTVVAAEANCTTTIRESGVVLEDSYQTNDCQLEYQGNIIPNMTWTGAGTYSQRYIATPTHIWAGMQFNATREMNGLAFQCVTEFTDYFLPVPGNTADNVPDYRRTDQSKQMFVQWGPKNIVIVPVKQRYDIGDILTCTADGNPEPTFFWQNLRTNQVFAGNQVIVLDDWQGTNQTLRCDSRNTIEDVIYNINAFQIVDVNPATTTTEPPTTTTTTPPPAESDCFDLTGGWESDFPTHGELCLRLDTENNGALRGLLKNESDTFWVDIVGRAQATKFDQLGFNGIWPLEIGVSSFIGECHRCQGLEQMLVNVVSRSKSSQCGAGGPIRYTTQYTFYRSPNLPCPNLPAPARS